MFNGNCFQKSIMLQADYFKLRFSFVQITTQLQLN